jgi:flagellar hook assembly protein FlgD
MTGNTPLPKEYALRQNYPNPFNMETRIHFELPEEGHVTITIYNLLGMEVETLVDDYKNAGYYSLVWNGRKQIAASTGSGLYICRIRANDFRKSIKMLLLK